MLSANESWPTSTTVLLNPVIQLCINDLSYILDELKDIRYLCVFIHPDDPASFKERNDGLVFRYYKSNDIKFITKPDSVEHSIQLSVLEFEKFDDYPYDYTYPSSLDYLTCLDKQKYYSRDKTGYDWLKDFSCESNRFGTAR